MSNLLAMVMRDFSEPNKKKKAANMRYWNKRFKEREKEDRAKAKCKCVCKH